MGEVVIQDRIGTRRYFELAERALPRGMFTAADPNVSTDDYRDWHVLRRVGGLGIANPAAGDWWLGIKSIKPMRNNPIQMVLGNSRSDNFYLLLRMGFDTLKQFSRIRQDN